MSALRSGEYVPPQDDGYDPEADMKALRGAHKRKPKEVDTYMNREQLMELRKVQAERIEVREQPSSACFILTICVGGQDEVARDGNQTKSGCSHGRHRVRRLIRVFRLSATHVDCYLNATILLQS